MLKRLKIKIVVVVMGTLLMVFGAVLLALNLSVYQTSMQRTGDFMNTVAENDGFFFPPRVKPGTWRGGGPAASGNPEVMRAGRFFYAKTDPKGGVLEMNLEMMYDFTHEDALRYIEAAADTGREKGDIENFSFLFVEKDYGAILVFAERSIELNLLEQLTGASLWAAGIVSLVLACLSAFFANWMTGPVKATFEKQQRFISDASHELKTPLTIINTNLDVLEHEIGNHVRLEQVKCQLRRMNGLVHDLLTLAKAEETRDGRIFHTFPVSRVVLGTVLEFESLAFEAGKSYEYRIEEGLSYLGDEQEIKRLVSTLIDNAIRYSGERGEIRIRFERKGSRPYLSVFNTGIGVPNEEREKIFERFYRRDESRSRETGGYGIGLSIAGAIVKAHRGKIAVSGEYGKWICFDVLM